MVICLERGANDLHMVQLMPLPPHHLLLHHLVLAYPGCSGKRPSNGLSSVVLMDVACSSVPGSQIYTFYSSLM